MTRDRIVDNFRSLMLGPIFGENEVLDRHPLEYYSCGIIYPRNLAFRKHKDVKSEEENDKNEEEIEEVDSDTDISGVQLHSDDSSTESSVSSTDDNIRSMYPGSFGMSFLCVDNADVSIDCELTLYSVEEKKQPEMKEANSNNKIDISDDVKEYKKIRKDDTYRASVLKKNFIINISDGESSFVETKKMNDDGFELVIDYSKLADNLYFVKLLFYNTFDAQPQDGNQVSPKSKSVINKLAFRPVIRASMKSESLKDISRSVKIDYSSDRETEMLYRNNKNQARGHNCAVKVTVYGNSTELTTEFLPEVKVKILKTELPGFKSEIDVFSTATLSENNDKQMVMRSLKAFAGSYLDWINEQHPPADYAAEFNSNKDKCNLIYKRIMQGVQLLEQYEKVYQVWQDTHCAMKMQFEKNNKNKVLLYRPFQLAFILMNIGELVDQSLIEDDLIIDEIEYRSFSDLIWVVTGGGKTEAYLALTAFIILYRRMEYKQDGYGLAVISRYTLRLLTSQQFSRAATLICALEKIRRENEAAYLDKNYPIILGLFIGSAATPNSVDKVDLAVRFKLSNNPFPVKICPWCGKPLHNNSQNLEDRNSNSFFMHGSKMLLHCLNQECEFKDFLPLNFIDSMLEGNKPNRKNPCYGSSMLISTADKYAMLPFKTPQFQNILFYGRHPDLIIQDELHLIDGALGSLFGLYETTHGLFWDHENPVKIIASTATPKEAESQIRLLFNKKTAIFPYPLQIIEDTYFTKLTNGESEEERNGRRLYVGVMPAGVPSKTAARNAATALLVASAAVNEIKQRQTEKSQITWFDIDDSDPYKMITCYFNSVRELGGFSAMVEDDIPIRLPDILRLMVKREKPDFELRKSFFNRSEFHKLKKKELTGRISDTELARQLDDLENGKMPDILQCTNMISVGIDISTLNIMMVAGQPKRTAEYIQASSRTGRKTKNPGIVVMLYNPMRIRDVSYYEFFYPYHQSFYRYVEPVSVTPYSRHCLTRGLLSQLITIMKMVQLESNNASNKISISVDDLGSYIDRLNDIVSAKIGDNEFDYDYLYKNYKDELKSVIEFIEKFYNENESPSYTYIRNDKSKTDNYRYLAKFYGEIEHLESREIMSSLRNVSGECAIKLVKD